MIESIDQRQVRQPIKREENIEYCEVHNTPMKIQYDSDIKTIVYCSKCIVD